MGVTCTAEFPNEIRLAQSRPEPQINPHNWVELHKVRLMY